MRLPSLRIFHIDQEFVERSISKKKTMKDFHFEMSYTEYQAKMDVSGMKYHRDNFRNYVETLINNSLKEIMAIVQPAAIS